MLLEESKTSGERRESKCATCTLHDIFDCRSVWRKGFRLTCAFGTFGRFELGRPEAGTKLSSHVSVKKVRVRGGNYKFRAMRLDTGTYSWASEHCTRKVRILDVSYNATNNELVRTQTLVKNAIVQVDATPFKTYYLQHYDVDLGKKKVEKGAPKSELTQKKIAARQVRELPTMISMFIPVPTVIFLFTSWSRLLMILLIALHIAGYSHTRPTTRGTVFDWSSIRSYRLPPRPVRPCGWLHP